MQEPLFVEEPTLSVAQLSSALAGALTRAFPDELWVRGEIANLSRPSSGHVYFDLVGDGACISVSLFDADRQVVNRILRRAGGAVRMTDGTEVRIRGRVAWFARRGSLHLRMVSIDTGYTLGRLAEDRELLVRRLAGEGLLERQAVIALPLVPLRVGLVTSDGSAAAADFLHTLEASGWAWRVTLADARVQGVEAGASVVAALTALGRRAVDVVCVVRGGGARTDLATFDQESVARALAACPVPVFTGIGHEVDTTVADLVAYRSCKTPTACAGALVERVTDFLDRCTSARGRLARAAGLAVERSEARLHRASGRAAGAGRHHVRSAQLMLDSAGRRLAVRTPRAIDAATRVVDGLAARLAVADPARVLARGWTITRGPDGQALRSARAVAPGDELVTVFADGEVRSVVR
ncbi:MAG: exodeoxyribonuclease VII large subunit [Acidimicrobiales bacterium]